MDQPQAAKPPRFSLGQVVATPGALAALAEAAQTPHEFLARHIVGDWGEELPAEDAQENEFSLAHGLRLVSSYRTTKGEKFWIITEHDVRRVTA